MRIYLPNMGFPSPVEAEGAREEARRTRAFEGLGGPFIPVPGLLKLERVATRGLIFEEVLTRDMPIAPGMQATFPLTVDCTSVIQGADGTPLLARHPWSNDGIFQTGEMFYITGEWDEAISPAPEEPLKPLERVHRPVLTGPNVMDEGGEVRVGKAAKS